MPISAVQSDQVVALKILEVRSDQCRDTKGREYPLASCVIARVDVARNKGSHKGRNVPALIVLALLSSRG